MAGGGGGGVWYAVVLLLSCIAIPGVRSDGSDHKYKASDPVPLYANKVGPFHNPRVEDRGLKTRMHRLKKSLYGASDLFVEARPALRGSVALHPSSKRHAVIEFANWVHLCQGKEALEL